MLSLYDANKREKITSCDVLNSGALRRFKYIKKVRKGRKYDIFTFLYATRTLQLQFNTKNEDDLRA